MTGGGTTSVARRSDRRSIRPAWLVVAMFAVLTTVWLATDPPGAAPDEEQHLYKAVAAGNLELVGGPDDRGYDVEQRRHVVVQSTRSFVVPGRLVSDRLGCNRTAPAMPASCLEGANGDAGAGDARVTTYVATYPPFLYVLPGWVARRAADPLSAVYLARVVMATLGLALLAVAAASLWHPEWRGLSLVGLLVAMTPMVQFLNASVNISGVEILASVAFLAVLIGAARPGSGIGRRWIPLALSGTVLALSRPTGPVWVALGLFVYALLVGGRLGAELRGGGSRLAAAGAGVSAASLVTLGWTSWQGPSGRFPLSGVAQTGPALLREAPSIASQAVGVFGWLDTVMPPWAYTVWYALLVALVLGALAIGTNGERAAIALVAVALVAAAVVMQTVVLGPSEVTQQWVQGRYLLPVAVALPLLGGEVVARGLVQRDRARAPAFAVVLGATTLVHLAALWVTARRNAVGVEGPLFFLSDARWAPPGGWRLWAAVASLVPLLALLAWWTGGRVGNNGAMSAPRRPLVTVLLVAVIASITAVASDWRPATALTRRWEATVSTGKFMRSAPTVADIDGNGSSDVVVGNLDGHVYAFDADGRSLPGWPQPALVAGGATAVESSPAVGDLDNDGGNEVVVGAGSLDVQNQQGGLVVLHGGGGIRCSFQTRDIFNEWTGDSRPGPDGYTEAVWGSPALGDVDGNGLLDIVFGSFDHRLYVLDHACGVMGYFDNIDTIFSSPALHDVTGDGLPEIFFGADASGAEAGGVMRALTWREGGVHELWNHRIGETIWSSPAIADINGDGRLEAVVGTGLFYGNSPDSNRVFAFDLATGDDVPGWPVDVGSQTLSSPAVGDLDGDRRAEVVIGTIAGRTVAFRGDGTRLWDVDPCAGVGGCGGEPSSPAIGDVNGNGTSDVAIGNNNGVLLLDGRTGAHIDFLTGFGEHNAPAVVDLGGQPAVVIAGAVGGGGVVRAYRVPPSPLPPAWPMFRGGPAHRGGPPVLGCFGVPTKSVARLAGNDRIGTAIAISAASFGDGRAQAGVLARSDNFPDALAGTPLAVAKNGPLLLTGRDALEPRVAAELQRAVAKGRTVHVLGGEGALSATVANQVEALGFVVERYAGGDRFETAALVADRGLANPNTLLLATGTKFADALAAGAAAPRASAAVLLTGDGVMPPATAAYLAAHPAPRRYAIGGPAAAADPAAQPVVGDDRYDTARRVAETFVPSPPVVGFASGRNFPDALGGGVHVARLGGPLLLSDPGDLPAVVRDYTVARRGTLNQAFLYGGPAALSEVVRSCVGAAVG